MSVSAYDNQLVVVVGGAGYIGSALVRRLLKDGYRVRVFDNFLYGRDGLTAVEHPLLEVIEGDICDTKAISSAIIGADTVVLLAAIVGRRAEDITRDTTRDINFLASTVVLDAAIEHGASRFIFASTDSVYGVQPGVMYETGTPEPVSLYSRLKLRMEERVINSKKRSFHPTALRIATCHGYSPRMRFDLVVNGLVRDAVCRKEMTVIGGEQVRALIHVEDVARAFMACIKAHVNLVSGEVFNVGPKEKSVKINDLVNMVKTLVPDARVNVCEGEPDLVDYHLSSSKIEKILDVAPRWTLEHSMEQIRDLLLEGRFGDPYSPKYHNT